MPNLIDRIPMRAIPTLIATAFCLIPVSTADASTYNVHECWNGFGAPDAVQEGNSTGPRLDNFCGGSSFLQAGSSGAVAPNAYRQWMFRAPTGTQINQAVGNYSLFSSNNPNGQQSYVSASRPGNATDTWLAHSQGSGLGFDASFNLAGAGQTPVDRLGIGVACTRDAANCEASTGTFAKFGQITFTMEDTRAPAAPVIGGPALNGWQGGNTTMTTYVVSDVGAGVHAGGTLVNGTGVDLDGYCPNNAGQFDNTGTATRMGPCPAATFGSSSLDITNAPFVQGDNTIQHCVSEYGTDPQSTCSSNTIKVDTIDPGSVASPSVDGGEDWHRDNDFDLGWSNRPQPPNSSPIVAAELRIVGDSYDNSSLYQGQNIDHINNVQVPAKGAYSAQIYLIDAAGNRTSQIGAASQSVRLKFDNTVPDPQARQGQRVDQPSGARRRLSPAVGRRQRGTRSTFRHRRLPRHGQHQRGQRPLHRCADPRVCGGR